MRKQFGRRPRVGENHAAGALGVYATHANENLFPLLPSGSVRDQAIGSSLKRFNASDTFRDVIAVGFVLLFVLSVALSFVGAFFLMAFCQF